ncbi:MAG: YtxH domain-containing protein [Bacilli bacterium]|nr:YtxH domain-containing protein [Bacilli bacterium]MDD4718484.1 YtxH domain-containing protein [Bacilli bacterium]
MSKKKGFGKFLTGALVGAGLGVLFAPKKGSETRKELKIMIEDFLEELKDVDMDEVRENIETKIFEIKMELEDLDKEKALKIAKKKAKDIQNMVEELVEYSVEKGTPVLEGMANSIRESSIKVTKEILAKLENTDN